VTRKNGGGKKANVGSVDQGCDKDTQPRYKRRGGKFEQFCDLKGKVDHNNNGERGLENQSSDQKPKKKQMVKRVNSDKKGCAQVNYQGQEKNVENKKNGKKIITGKNHT